MNKRILILGGLVAVFSLALLALPSPSATSQTSAESSARHLQHSVNNMQAEIKRQQARFASLAEARALQESASTLVKQLPLVQELDELDLPESGVFSTFLTGEGSSWLGVETHEVTADKAKELKLTAESGVVLGKVVPDSPAAKAGLKDNDVVTQVNGQHVEGTAQFRRVIREIPAGRNVQLTVWRDGRTQTVSVTLGKAEEHHHARMHTAPGAFAFHMPEIPEIPPMNWDPAAFAGAHPRLGIDAEDLTGQLGAYFGVPEGEGILVRDVSSGSPAEKAGMKAGDVITSVNGDRVRSAGELREKLSAKRDEKDKSVKLGILRNKSEMSVNVELPAPAQRSKRMITHRTNI